MKTSKLVGWSQHPLSCDSTSPQPLEPWMSSYGPPTASATTVLTPNCNSVHKDPATNTSLDSGVAGLRDTPVHTPAPAACTNVNMPGPKPPNTSSDDYDVPKFIVDQTTRTTYMKGRFLGKVSTSALCLLFVLHIFPQRQSPAVTV